MNKTRTILLQSLIALIPIGYYAFIWHKLPETVPMHYDSSNQPNGWGSKWELLGALGFMLAINTGVSALIMNLDKLDPKKKYQGNSRLILKLSWALTIFLTMISAFIVYDTEVYCRTNSPASLMSVKFLLSFVALLFVVIGNFMNSIKPNYFVGIRTPWNLEDEDNWRKTHHLSSKLWFFGGLIMIALIFVLPEQFALFVFLGIIIPLAVIPFVYSYNLFRKKQNSA